jgi:hypothetical protein
VLEASKASTYDLLNNQILILQKSAVKEIEKTFAASEGGRLIMNNILVRCITEKTLTLVLTKLVSMVLVSQKQIKLKLKAIEKKFV